MDVKMESVINLPGELLTEILLRLPVKSLIRFKCVSKAWRDQIDGSDFISLHLSRSLEANSGGSIILLGRFSLSLLNFSSLNQRSTELHYPLEMEHSWVPELVGSCNGLVCFKVQSFHFTLYNPATRAFKQLPQMVRKLCCFSVRGDFAYDIMSDDYKVLMFVRYYKGMMEKVGEETYLYSLKSNVWETIPNPPWGSSFVRSRSVVVNNSLHWIAYNDNNVEVIRYLDLFTQEYDEMPLPRVVGPSPKLAVLRGHLHVVTERIDIWMMKEYGVTESWTQLFHCLPRQLEKIQSSSFGQLWPLPYAYSNDGRKILVGVEEKPDNFICCDLEYQATSKFEILGLPVASGGLVAEPWVESLVPLL